MYDIVIKIYLSSGILCNRSRYLFPSKYYVATFINSLFD